MSQHPEFRLAENTSPMKLCDVCSTLNIDVLSKNFYWHDCLEHQPNFTALETSASTGCEMCSMFLHAVMEVHCHNKYTKRSPVEALQTFRKAALGKASCLIRPTWERNQMVGILYSVPKCVIERRTKYMNEDFASAHFTLRNCRGVGDERISQTELTRLPDWTIARKWIQECIERHNKCWVKQTNNQRSGVNADSAAMGLQLPTRLVYVGSTDGGDPHLVIGSKRTFGYVALSHCWGKGIPLTTTLLNFHRHLESIPFSSLPRTFQDAIIATRELGYQYLWIDSLCIIQDSTEDWELECSKMAHIYRNSRVTICGTTASDSSSGFLHPRTCPEPAPYLWEYRNAEKVEKRATISLNVNQTYRSSDYPDKSHLTKKEEVSPLRLRGWVLQEYLLSTRLLFFGLYRTYWQCSECVRFEDFQQPNNSSDIGLHCKISNSALSPFEIGNRSNLSEIWHSIVEEYRYRSLSKSTDALPALSGIADWILGGRGDDYMAGLLKHALHKGLAWSIRIRERETPFNRTLLAKGRENRYPEIGRIQDLPTCRSPSWSWTSTNYPISFIDPEKASRSRNLEQAKRLTAAVSSMSRQNQMEVYDVSIKLHGSNPFGEVRSGTIKLRGRVKTGIVVANQSVGKSNLAVADPISRTPTALFFPDDPQWDLSENMGTEISKADPPFDEEEEDSVTLPRRVWPQEVKCLCIDYWNIDSAWAALAIEELPSEHQTPDTERAGETSAYKAYRRIGLVECWGILDSDFFWFKDSSEELIELF